MPRKKEAGGIPPHLKVLSAVPLNGEITPAEIDALVPYATGYASKYIFELKKLGFVFTTTKNGRNIVNWKLVLEPADAARLRLIGSGNPLTERSVSRQADEYLKEIGL